MIVVFSKYDDPIKAKIVWSAYRADFERIGALEAGKYLVLESTDPIGLEVALDAYLQSLRVNSPVSHARELGPDSSWENAVRLRESR